MINEFKKYDKEHIRLVTISVSDFNELIKETNISIETKWDYDLKSLESINDLNKRIGEPEINLNEYRNMYRGVRISIVNNRNDNIPATFVNNEEDGWCHYCDLVCASDDASFDMLSGYGIDSVQNIIDTILDLHVTTDMKKI